MNVTSMLSNGYLQPFHSVHRTVEEKQEPSTALAAQEQQVLAQERGLKTASGPDAKVSTTYHYAVGPDGKRYITGAEVSIESAQQGGGEPKKTNLGDKAKASAEKQEKAEAESNDDQDGGIDAEVSELKRIEQEVIAHEAAHQAAGGGLAGAVSYTYTKGPDGKSYITGGEVPIQMPVSDDPEETLRNMEQVQRAALAPGTPSGQDISVAGKAASAAAQARQELAAKGGDGKDKIGSSDDASTSKMESGSDAYAGFSSGVSSVKAGLMFERINGEEGNGEGYVTPIVEELPGAAMLDPREAYGKNSSDRGLWALGQGFEPMSKTGVSKPNFDIAA